MMPKVAIVYLSYNGKHYLEEVLFALRALDYPKDRLELIFVDNDSHDGSQEYLRELKDITFFPQTKNLGFAGGNNIGIEHALLNGADYVFLHNNDLKLDPSAILHAVTLAQSDARIGSVQSLMLLWKQPDIINSTGGMVHFLGFGFVRENGRKSQDVMKLHKEGEEITYASGAAVLFRASVLKEIGLLDEFLFLYHEDLELGWRVRLAGYINVLSVQSKAYHDYEFKRSVKKFYWMERNRWLVHFSHLKWQTLLLIFPWLLLIEIPLCVFAMKGGWVKQWFFAVANLFQPRTWSYLARKRKESVHIRRVTDQQIVSLFTDKIDHQETQSLIVTQIANPFFSTVWKYLRPLIKW